MKKDLIGIEKIEEINKDLINDKKNKVIFIESTSGMGKTSFINSIIKRYKYKEIKISPKATDEELSFEMINSIKKINKRNKYALVIDNIDEYHFFESKELIGACGAITTLVSIINSLPDNYIVILSYSNKANIDNSIINIKNSKSINLDNITNKNSVVEYYSSFYKITDKEFLDEITNNIDIFSVKDIKELMKLYKNNNNTIMDVVRDIVKTSKKDKSNIDLEVSYHESGHALCAYLLNRIPKIVSINKKDNYLGVVVIEEGENSPLSIDDMLVRIKIALASSASEEIFLNKKLLGSQQDYSDAYQYAYNVITKYNYLGPKYLSNNKIPNSNNKQQMIEEEVTKLLTQSYDEVYQLINNNKEKVEIIKDELIKKRVLSSDDMKLLISE